MGGGYGPDTYAPIELPFVADGMSNISPTAYGIALDYLKNYLYVANGPDSPIMVYNTSDWTAVSDTYTPNGFFWTQNVASAIAIDSPNRLLYYGDLGNPLVNQHDLNKSDPNVNEANPPIDLTSAIDLPQGTSWFGVSGLAVDYTTGNVYVSAGYLYSEGAVYGCYLVACNGGRKGLIWIPPSIPLSIPNPSDNNNPILGNAGGVAFCIPTPSWRYVPRWIILPLPPWLEKWLSKLF